MKKTFIPIASVAALLGLAAPVSTLKAADVTWDNGAANGLWTSGANWNPADTLPGDADTAIIGGTLPAAIDATGAATIDALRITRAVTFNNGTITMDGIANQSGGSGVFQTNPGGASNNVFINSNLSFTGNTTSGIMSMIRVDGQGTTTVNGTVTNANNLGQPGSKLFDFTGGIGIGQTATLIFNGSITSTRTTGQTEMEINRGTLELNAANTFTNAGSLRFVGGVTTGTGTLKIGHATALGTSSFSIGGGDGGLAVGNTYTAQTLQTGANTVANAILFRNVGATAILGADIASGTATYSGGVTLQRVTSGTAGAINLRSVQAGGTVNFSGLISDTGAGAITRDLSIGDATTGLGKVNFSRAAGNTYTGNTTVVGGTLLVNNTSNSGTGTGTVTVNTGATLGGNGSISGATTINGILAPGNSIGQLTIANDVTWNDNDAWKFELGTSAATQALANTAADGSNDRLYVTGGVGSDFLKGTGSSFTFDFLGTGSTGFYKLVDWTGTTASTFANGDFVATGLTSGLTGSFIVDNTTQALYLSVVPEPTTWALLAGSMTVLMAFRRRRA